MAYFSVEDLGMLDVESIEGRNDNDATEPKGCVQSIFWSAIKGQNATLYVSDAEVVGSAAYKISLAAEKLRRDAREKEEAVAALESCRCDPGVRAQVSSMKENLETVERFCDDLILSASRLASEYALFEGRIGDVASVLKCLGRSRKTTTVKKAS